MRVLITATFGATMAAFAAAQPTPNGLPSAQTSVPYPLRAHWMVQSDREWALYGALSSAGDVNGDGYDDLIVGAYGYDDPAPFSGRVFVYHGSAGGLSTTPDWTVGSGQGYAYFGAQVAGAGDVNGDGYDDVIIGAESYDDPAGAGEGAAFVFLGSASGLQTSPAWSAYGEHYGSRFGVDVAGAGDVNGDGYSDVIVGAMNLTSDLMWEGRAYVFGGSAAGLQSAPMWTADGDQAESGFAGNVASAGDVNGDGYDEVIVTALDFDNGETDEGRVFLYLGSAGGPEITASWSAEGNETGRRFGLSRAAGDVDGDGYGDVIVGDAASNYAHPGRVLVYHGSPTGLEAVASWAMAGHEAGAMLGNDVGADGDVDDDGFADVLVRAPYFTGDSRDHARVFLYRGSAVGLRSRPSWSAVSETSYGFGFGLGSGDANGDGHADILIGDLTYSEPEVNEGAAFAFLGADFFLQDRFETGDLFAWARSVTDSRDLRVAGAAALASSRRGLRALVDDDAPLYVEDDSPEGAARYRARFYVDPNGFASNVGGGAARARLFYGLAVAPGHRLFDLTLKYESGVYWLAGRVRRSDGSYQGVGRRRISNRPHSVELDWRRSSAAGVADGEFSLWVDGTLVETAANVKTASRGLDSVRLGVLDVTPGALGTLYLDEFESRRETYIGP